MDETNITFDDIRNYRALSAELYALQLEQTMVWNLIHSPNGRQSIGEARGNTTSDPTARAAMRLIELDELIGIQLEEVTRKLTAIHKFLDELPDREVASMCKLHYLDNVPWRLVAIRMYYSNESSVRSRVMRYFGRETSE